jgi:TamB, inner membrane protein subunit of TAM complex
LKDFVLNDVNGKEAIANGTVRHDYFKRFVFDIGLRAKEFECLHTTAAQNSLYYGRAIGSGFASFKGMIQNMNINIAMTSRKGTVIAIPLGGLSEISQSGHITFLKPVSDSAKDDENIPWTNPSGVNLEMSFNITPDAELQLIFDEKIGDIISGSGNGDLRLVVTDDGTFRMYGNYVIERGSYLFTLRNVINKRFQIEKGGYISWTGDPYDADINMDATYRVYTSTLYSLINDSTFKKRLAVDCKLNLTNKLMNPTIRYTIDVPGVDGATQAQISSVLNSEAEVSKQFFGLLVLNQFIPQGNSNQSTTAFDGSLGANAFESLSNQFNNWLSRLSTDFSVGVNYRARDAYSSEQVQLMISKSFWDDKLTVDGTFGLYNSTTTQTASNPLGDFNVEYKVSEDGRFRVKAYNHSNENYSIEYNSPYTQGLGISYREEFDSLKELMIRWRLAKKKEETEDTTPKPIPAPILN